MSNSLEIQQSAPKSKKRFSWAKRFLISALFFALITSLSFAYIFLTIKLDKKFLANAVITQPISVTWELKGNYDEEQAKRCANAHPSAPFCNTYPKLTFIDHKGEQHTFSQKSFESRKGHTDFSCRDLCFGQYEKSLAEVLYDPNNPNKAVLAKSSYAFHSYGNSLFWNLICALTFILISLALLSFLLIKYLIKNYCYKFKI